MGAPRASWTCGWGWGVVLPALGKLLGHKVGTVCARVLGWVRNPGCVPVAFHMVGNGRRE